MNKYLYILFGMFFLSSCQDFLVEESRSQMTEDYYQTDQGLYEGVASVYSVYRTLYQHDMFRINYYGDVVENASSMNNSYEQSSDVGWGTLNNVFSNLHKGIMIANRMEKIIEQMPEIDRTEKIYLGELRGLRANLYQIQVELWGKYGHFQEKVYTEYEESMMEINQQSVAYFYDQILSDIDFAIENLPAKNEISEFGRLTEGAAKALKARYLLAIAGYSHPEYAGEPEHDLYNKLGYSSLQEVYSEAKDLASSVVSDYGYKLENEYSDVFDAFNQENDEVIWSVQWTTEKMFNTDPQYFHRPAVGRTNETLEMVRKSDGTVTATTKSLVVSRKNDKGENYNYSMPAHSMYYGREYRHVMPTFSWINMYSDEDKRKLATFQTVYYRIDDDKAAPPDMTDTVCYMPLRIISYDEDVSHRNWVESGDPKAYYLDGLNEVYDLNDPTSDYYGGPLLHRSRYYSVKKFYDRSRVEMGKQEEGHANAILVRLPEMHLIIAECNWNLGLGDDAVFEALEPIWARSFDDLEDAAVYQKDGVDLDFILDEYQRELGLEFNTFFILKRTRSLVSRIMKNNPKSKEETEDNISRWRDYVRNEHYIKPLPLNQVNSFSNITDDMLPPGYDY